MPAETTSPPARRVVLTADAGRIGRSVLDQPESRWDLRATDREPAGRVSGRPGSQVAALDVTDLDACRAASAGADAVVRLAANPSPAPVDDVWADER